MFGISFRKKEPKRTSQPESFLSGLPEENPHAHRQNNDEVDFNRLNPRPSQRADNALKKWGDKCIKKMSKDDKYDLLEKSHIEDAVRNEFKYLPEDEN